MQTKMLSRLVSRSYGAVHVLVYFVQNMPVYRQTTDPRRRRSGYTYCTTED